MGARIVFLCTANICRSPVAEVLARDRFAATGLDFVSAGLDTVPGHGASAGSVAWAAARGLDLAGHRSRFVGAALEEGTAWVIGMDRGHAALFRSRCPESYAGAIGYLGAPGVDLADGRPSPVGEEVEDPYGGNPEDYRRACEKIRRLLEGWEPVFTALARDRRIAE
jgi:protein-tyrosine phosphatase